MNGEMFDEELREQIEQMMADGQLDELIRETHRAHAAGRLHLSR